MISNEQAVIAAVLLDSRVTSLAVKEVAPVDFEDGRLGALFERIAGMVARRLPVDVLTVGEALSGWGIRGVEEWELHDWISGLPTAENVGFYAAQVRSAAMRRSLRLVGQRLLSADGSAEPAVVAAEAAEDLKQLQSGYSASEEGPRPLEDVLEGDVDYDWLVPGLLERRDRLMLTGIEGGGKSTFVRQIGIAAGAGIHPFTFMRTEPIRVLFLDSENSEIQWRREAGKIQQVAARYGTWQRGMVQLKTMSRADLTKDATLSTVHRWIDEAAPDLLCIGPLYRLVPRAINSDDDAAPLLAALDTLRDRGCAMVIEAHAGHAMGAAGVRDLRPRGSAALLGWPEFGFGLARDPGGRDENDYQVVRWRGDRDRRSWPTRLSRNKSAWPWTPTAAWQAAS